MERYYRDVMKSILPIITKARIAVVERDEEALKKIESVILTLGNPEFAYIYAYNLTHVVNSCIPVDERKDFPIDIKPFEKMVLNANDPKLSFYFARDVIGADYFAHLKIVQNSNLTKQKRIMEHDAQFVV